MSKLYVPTTYLKTIILFIGLMISEYIGNKELIFVFLILFLISISLELFLEILVLLDFMFSDDSSAMQKEK